MSAIKTIQMTVKEFIKIQDNPLQRDTITHAKKAKKFHLNEHHESHSKVAVAKLGKLFYKLDGHTRAYLWDKQELLAPDHLSVDVYPVKSIEEVVDLYKTFDNTKAAESNSDKIIGALNYLGIKNYNINFMRNSGLLNALRSLNSTFGRYRPHQDIEMILKPYKKEIQALANQQWSPAGQSKGKKMAGFPSPVVASFIITYRLYGDDCLGFWDDYYYNINSLKSGRSGAKAASDYIIKARVNEQLLGSRWKFQHIEAIVTAYLRHRAKKPVPNIKALYSRNEKLSTMKQLHNYLLDIGMS